MLINSISHSPKVIPQKHTLQGVTCIPLKSLLVVNRIETFTFSKSFTLLPIIIYSPKQNKSKNGILFVCCCCCCCCCYLFLLLLLLLLLLFICLFVVVVVLGGFLNFIVNGILKFLCFYESILLRQ